MGSKRVRERRKFGCNIWVLVDGVYICVYFVLYSLYVPCAREEKTKCDEGKQLV